MVDRGSPRSIWAEAARYADLGLRLVVSVAVCAAGGYWLDRKLGWIETFPFLTLGGFFLGLAAGFWALVKGIAAIERDDPKRDRDSEGGGRDGG